MIIKQLIDHYEKVITEYKVNKDFWYLVDEECSNGLCNYARFVFSVEIYEHQWLIDALAGNNYLFDTPEFYQPFEYNLELLKLRLNLLKYIYEKAQIKDDLARSADHAHT